MSERRVIAAEVVTNQATPTPHDYTTVRTTMLTTAQADGYTDITRLHHVHTEPWSSTVSSTHRHRFEAVAARTHKP